MESAIYDEVVSGKPIDLVDFPLASLNFIAYAIHRNNVVTGWWTDLHTNTSLDRNFGELLCLVHSELSEAMEGHRKNLQDDHLPQYPMWQVELADAFIRICDMVGAADVNFGEIVAAKLAYNAERADHKIASRKLADGKKY